MRKLYIIPTNHYNYAQGVDKLFFSCYNTVPWRERSGRQLNNTYLHTYFLVPPLSFRTRTYYIGTEHHFLADEYCSPFGVSVSA